MQEQFADWEHGGYFYTAQDHEKLIARQKDIQDNPVPSGNAGIANALLRLGKLTGRGDYIPAAETTLTAFSTYMQRVPTATGQMLLALDFYLGPTFEIVVLGDARSETTHKVLADLRRRKVDVRRRLEDELRKLDSAIEAIETMVPQPDARRIRLEELDIDSAIETTLKPYHGLTIRDAAFRCLEANGKPLKTKALAEALLGGGFKTSAMNFQTTVYGSLSRYPRDFGVKDGTWSLRKWKEKENVVKN